MVLYAAVAALAFKVPGWFGTDLAADDSGFYARNVSVFAPPPLAAYIAWQRRIGPRVIRGTRGTVSCSARAPPEA